MTTLVTGASGLLGSTVCRLGVTAGRRMRGLVRKQADADVLAALGVEPVLGDITDPDSLRLACDGVDDLVHSAAVLGGTWSTATEKDFERINYQGSLNVLDAARTAGVARTVVISSLIVFRKSVTVTEDTPMLDVKPGMSAYARSKLGIYHEGMHRVCRGEHISFVMPGAMYGPSVFPVRALDPTSFTGTLHSAIHGELTEYARFPLNWPYVEDAGAVVLGALERGRPGAIHLAAGGPDDALSVAELCNLACAEAGVEHRVRDLDPADMSSDIGSMRSFAEATHPKPLVDPARTNEELDIRLTPVEEGVARTVEWMREQKLL